MEHVFIVKHDIYGYEDNIHESFIEVFCNEDSAKNFFEIKKEEIIQKSPEKSGDVFYCAFSPFNLLFIPSVIHCF